VAVRDWVAYFGAVVNVHPDLNLFRLVRSGPDDAPLTSLERERRGPLRPALVRQRLIERFQAAFPAEQTALFSHHPALGRADSVGAVASRPGTA
jgi:lipoate-protein ligase B